MCLHFAAFIIPYFDMQHDPVLKKLNFDLLTLPPGSRRGSMGKILDTMLMYVSFSLI